MVNLFIINFNKNNFSQKEVFLNIRGSYGEIQYQQGHAHALVSKANRVGVYNFTISHQHYLLGIHRQPELHTERICIKQPGAGPKIKITG